MYKVDDLVIYGNNGVCKIEDVGVLNVAGINKDRIYYTLNPVNQGGKIFAPVDTSVFMRPIITYDEVQKLIESIPSIEEQECNEKNARLLQDHYKNLMESHECSDLLIVIKSIYEKKTNAISNGKKLGQIDEKYMKMAEDLIHDEFAVVLGIPRAEVEEYIANKVKEVSKDII